MAPSCPIGPFPSEGRSSSCFTLKGVKCKTISRARKHSDWIQHENQELLQLDVTQFSCRRARGKLSQFSSCQRGFKIGKTPAVLSHICLLMFLATARASSINRFDRECMIKWEHLKFPLDTIDASDRPEVIAAAYRLGGMLFEGEKLKDYHEKPKCFTLPTGYGCGKLSYWLPNGRGMKTPTPYQLLALVGRCKGGAKPTNVTAPVLTATQGKKTWLVFPVRVLDKETGTHKPKLAWVNKDFKGKDYRQCHFYDFHSTLVKGDADERTGSQGSRRSPSPSTSSTATSGSDRSGRSRACQSHPASTGRSNSPPRSRDRRLSLEMTQLLQTIGAYDAFQEYKAYVENEQDAGYQHNQRRYRNQY